MIIDKALWIRDLGDRARHRRTGGQICRPGGRIGLSGGEQGGQWGDDASASNMLVALPYIVILTNYDKVSYRGQTTLQQAADRGCRRARTRQDPGNAIPQRLLPTLCGNRTPRGTGRYMSQTKKLPSPTQPRACPRAALRADPWGLGPPSPAVRERVPTRIAVRGRRVRVRHDQTRQGPSPYPITQLDATGRDRGRG
jgi:hypothetical protein